MHTCLWTSLGMDCLDIWPVSEETCALSLLKPFCSVSMVVPDSKLHVLWTLADSSQSFFLQLFFTFWQIKLIPKQNKQNEPKTPPSLPISKDSPKQQQQQAFHKRDKILANFTLQCAWDTLCVPRTDRKVRHFLVSSVVCRSRVFHIELDHFSIRINILLSRYKVNGEMF